MLTYIKAQPAVFEPEEIIILVGAFDKAWHTVLAGGLKLEGVPNRYGRCWRSILLRVPVEASLIRIDCARRTRPLGGEPAERTTCPQIFLKRATKPKSAAARCGFA
jgi:hypothetical protein